MDLTETIKKLGVEKARELSEVSDLGNITSYSGFFTTSEIPAGNKKKNVLLVLSSSNNGDKDAPLLVWLQGGPGGSSMFGLFAEMGPFTLLGPKGPIELKESSWNKRYQMIFIDNPVLLDFPLQVHQMGIVIIQKNVLHQIYIPCYNNFTYYFQI